MPFPRFFVFLFLGSGVLLGFGSGVLGFECWFSRWLSFCLSRFVFDVSFSNAFLICLLVFYLFPSLKSRTVFRLYFSKSMILHLWVLLATFS